jgi:hypothetical protein
MFSSSTYIKQFSLPDFFIKNFIFWMQLYIEVIKSGCDAIFRWKVRTFILWSFFLTCHKYLKKDQSCKYTVGDYLNRLKLIVVMAKCLSERPAKRVETEKSWSEISE